MAHIPYGYNVQSGRAAIEPDASRRVTELFRLYLSGLSLSDAACQAGIQRCHASVAKMLTCKKYLGDAFYPPLISADVFEQAYIEKVKRARMLGRIREPELKHPPAKNVRFTASTPELLYEDPFAQAEYAYHLIKSEVIKDAGC